MFFGYISHLCAVIAYRLDTLPTGGWARAYSGVNTDSFLRKITYQELSRKGLATLSPTVIAMAEAEGLGAHAAAVRVRMKGGVL